MDMTVASLFKHKMRFTFRGVYTEIHEPTCFKRTHYYESPSIKNVESIGLKNVDDLHGILCKPLVLYAFSKIVHEASTVIPISKVIITVEVSDFQEGADYVLQHYCFENPLERPELFFDSTSIFSYLFPRRLLKERTQIFVNARCYYRCESTREEARFRREFNYDMHRLQDLSVIEYFMGMLGGWQEESDENEPYTPPVEPHREDCCVACLEAKPNILYFDCLHIVICDSCDRLKKTGRKNCDVCRAEIFKRVKI